MISSPKKKLKINEFEYKAINHNEKESTKEKININENKVIRHTNDNKNRKIWLCSKINSICDNLKIFRKKDDSEEKKKKNKRSFEDISKDTKEKKKEGNFRSSFGYLSLLKSLLHIYKFYTTNDVEYYVSSCVSSKYLEEQNCIQKDYDINDNEENHEEKLESFSEKEYITGKHKEQEKKTYNNKYNDIFVEIINEKSGFFFIFNTIFFTYLKNYYYFVDIVNILNYIGDNKSINKMDEKNKDILIYEQIALFVENNYDILIYNKKNSNNNIKNKYNNIISQKKLIGSVNNKSKDIEQIKINLESLKNNKSCEELLYISMNECNKKIYHELSKIPNLFHDIYEISDYSKNEIISDENHEKMMHHLNYKKNPTLYNDKNSCTSLEYDNFKNECNSLNSNSFKRNNLSLYNNENNILNEGNKEIKEENSEILENETHKSITVSECKDNKSKGYFIKKFLMNIFNRSKINNNINNENEISENIDDAVHINENINVLNFTDEKENTKETEYKEKYCSEKIGFIKNVNDKNTFGELRNSSNSAIKYEDEALQSSELHKTTYCNDRIKEQKGCKNENEKLRKKYKINNFENNESTNSESENVGPINNCLINNELKNSPSENKDIKNNELIEEYLENNNTINSNYDVHKELMKLKELNVNKEYIKNTNSISKEVNELFDEEFKKKELYESEFQKNIKVNDDDKLSNDSNFGITYSHKIEEEKYNSEKCKSENKSGGSEIKENNSVEETYSKEKEIDIDDLKEEEKKLDNSNSENKLNESELSYDELYYNKLNEVELGDNQIDDNKSNEVANNENIFEVEKNGNKVNESNVNNNQLNEHILNDSQLDKNLTSEDVQNNKYMNDNKHHESKSNEKISNHHTYKNEVNNDNNSDELYDNESNKNHLYDNCTNGDEPNKDGLIRLELDNKNLDEEEPYYIESNEIEVHNNELNDNKYENNKSNESESNNIPSNDNQSDDFDDNKLNEDESNDAEVNEDESNDAEVNEDESNDAEVNDEESNDEESHDKESNDKESSDEESNDEESHDKESNDAESNDEELNDEESNDEESHDKESNGAESNDEEVNDEESNDAESNDAESNERESNDAEVNDAESNDKESNDEESYENSLDESESINNKSDDYSEESGSDNYRKEKKKKKKYELEKMEGSENSDNILSFDKISPSNEIDDEQIINFLKNNKKISDKKYYREYLKNLLTCNKVCSIKDHSIEKGIFIKKVKKLCDLIKNKKFNDKYMNYWKCKVRFKCCKLQRAYKIFLAIICSIVKEINKLTKELNSMSNFIFINSGIENYLNEKNISIIEKIREDNDLIDNYFSENNIINDFFFNKNFSREEEKKKKYISYVPLENYKILLLCLKDIFNEKNLEEQLKNISYYIEFDNYIPNYCNFFYDKFKINCNYLYHIQSLYHNSAPTVECLNMFIACLNYNYSKIHKKKTLFKYELNNNYLSTLPFVYCCDIQVIKHLEFLKLKDTCQKIIKDNKIYENFLNHLFSYIFDESYFIIPFFTSYGKFLIIIKTNRNENSEISIDSLKNKNSITYDVIINSFVFPNDSSFHAIIHFSHIFIKCLKNFFKTRNSDENIPEISFANLLNIEKQQIIYQEIETNKNRNEIIINMFFLIESFFNNTKKIRVPKEFNQGLRFLYIIRLLEFFHEKD
ncbi:conserved Plasmodium protein, unknown function [Plasmodium gallinaceum]|uniref:Uncharacterized protein n=1 Tax=Plasmodium gallinaceum TaxID=5849 RepID=A0A1J1GXK0_PLAGA|nr:conserved Plasmodium protein, unknown function [Plasmodium gallinaceum]CRG97022.1 conserved Plasmodium protein, unknown function [Plasmodium gallinaceum]